MIFPVDSAGLVRRTLTAGGNRIRTLSVPPSRDQRWVDLAATAPRFVAAGVRPHPQFLRRPSRILILPMFRTGDAPPRRLDNFEHHVRPASSPTGRPCHADTPHRNGVCTCFGGDAAGNGEGGRRAADSSADRV